MAAAWNTLGHWRQWWIVCGCACGRSADLPVNLLAREYGEATPLDRIGARLRCQGCGARPAVVELVDHPQWDAPGFVGSAKATRRPLPLDG